MAIFSPLIVTFFGNNYSGHANNNLVIVLGLIAFWLIAVLIIILVKFKEKKDLTSIGLSKISFKSAGFAILLGIGLSMLVPLFTLLVNQIFPSTNNDLVTNTNIPISLLIFSIITAAVTEELIYRAYLISRLTDLIRNQYIAAIISVSLFTLIHSNNWSINHILGVVLPMGSILSYLYIKKKSVLFVILVHFFINLPLIFLAVGY